MINFQVNDMSCGHCVSSITKAVKTADPGARVQVDLQARRVQIEPGDADAETLREAIAEAGYTPLPLAAA